MKNRKLKKNIKKFLTLFILIVIFSVILIVIINLKQSKQTPVLNQPLINTNVSTVNINNNSGTVLDTKVEEIILKFMNKIYKSVATLKEEDITSLYDEESYEDLYIIKTAISLLIESRKLQLNDLSLTKANYNITITDISENNNILTIKFLEDNTLNFKFMGNINSNAYGISNTIIINTETLKVLSYKRVQDFYVMIDNVYKRDSSLTRDGVKVSLNEIKNNYIKEIKENIILDKESRDEYLNNKDIPIKECNNIYDRDKAYDYAIKYVTKRNSNYFTYDDTGGNCQNYASQVLFAGGIPMDTIGNIPLQWKHYSSAIVEKQIKSGRSYSWTGVGNFYNYAKNNSGYGLCALTNINFYYAEKGDIAQVSYNDNWNHTVAVIGTVNDKNGKVVDLIINSNTLNLENYPLSSYVYPDKRIVKIMGWNN